MERRFALKWADELGEKFLDKDSLEKLLRTKGFVDSRIQFEIEDITDGQPDVAEEEVPKAEETKPKTAKLAKAAEPIKEEAEKRGPCRFRVGSKCHRFPPKVMLDGGVKQYLNPGANDGCWCGEYKAVVGDASATE